MSNVFDHLHIKRHTAGSSNELSFDVLDAARGDLDAKKSRDSGTPVVVRPVRAVDDPKPVKGSYHGVKGVSTLSRQTEVTRRKTERKAHRLKLYIFAIVIAAVALGALTYAAVDMYQDAQKFKGQVNGLVDQFIDVDTILPSVEPFVASPFSTSGEDRQTLRNRLNNVAPSLDKVIADAAQDAGDAMGDQDEMVLVQVVSSAEARKKMYAAALGILDLVDAYEPQAASLTTIWQDVEAADKKARVASENAGKASTDKAIKTVRKQTKSARTSLSEALEKVKAMAGKNPALDLSVQTSYLELRIAALDHAILTSDALLDGDKAEATKQNDAYNTADKKAADKAKDLPKTPDETVKAAYQETLDGLLADYAQARDAAIEADALVRNYIR